MIYFDSDVFVHYFYPQDLRKQKIAQREIFRAASEGRAVVSMLLLQEVAFVLSKLKTPNDEIVESLDFMMELPMLDAELKDFKRASMLAQMIGFQNINDCLHTAIAEKHCLELQTFNHSDFKRIQPHTGLKIMHL